MPASPTPRRKPSSLSTPLPQRPLWSLWSLCLPCWATSSLKTKAVLVTPCILERSSREGKIGLIFAQERLTRHLTSHFSLHACDSTVMVHLMKRRKQQGCGGLEWMPAHSGIPSQCVSLIQCRIVLFPRASAPIIGPLWQLLMNQMSLRTICMTCAHRSLTGLIFRERPYP